MTDLYLIAHKVRGLPAFDIAEHMTCPKCEGTDDHCTACDGAGHWWIVPTSGHRAWPYWTCDLSDIGISATDCWEDSQLLRDCVPSMPPHLRDHYTTEHEAAVNLISALGLTKPVTPVAPIKRRF